MFEQEIINKNIVVLYDNQLKLLMRGVITRYIAKLDYIVIDYRVIFPTSLIAKITVETNKTTEQGNSVRM